jgi:hypothetical protein
MSNPYSNTTYDTNVSAVKVHFQDPSSSLNFSVLINQIEQLTAFAKSKIAQIQSKGSAMSIGDMFDLQMAMNKLQQFSEMSTSVISAMNTSINSMARNVKG